MSVNREWVANKVGSILWMDYCDADFEAYEEMEKSLGNYGYGAYSAIKNRPFEVAEMLLKVIEDKNREIEKANEDILAYRVVLKTINMRTEEVLKESR